MIFLDTHTQISFNIRNSASLDDLLNLLSLDISLYLGYIAYVWRRWEQKHSGMGGNVAFVPFWLAAVLAMGGYVASVPSRLHW